MDSQRICCRAIGNINQRICPGSVRVMLALIPVGFSSAWQPRDQGQPRDKSSSGIWGGRDSELRRHSHIAKQWWCQGPVFSQSYHSATWMAVISCSRGAYAPSTFSLPVQLYPLSYYENHSLPYLVSGDLIERQEAELWPL